MFPWHFSTPSGPMTFDMHTFHALSQCVMTGPPTGLLRSGIVRYHCIFPHWRGPNWPEIMPQLFPPWPQAGPKDLPPRTQADETFSTPEASKWPPFLGGPGFRGSLKYCTYVPGVALNF